VNPATNLGMGSRNTPYLVIKLYGLNSKLDAFNLAVGCFPLGCSRSKSIQLRAVYEASRLGSYSACMKGRAPAHRAFPSLTGVACASGAGGLSSLFSSGDANASGKDDLGCFGGVTSQ